MAVQGQEMIVNSVLLVCVGNICRSPMAEGLLAHGLAGHDPKVEVASAGISALVGYSAEPTAQALMLERDINISSHSACQLTPGMLQYFELVLVMEKRHIDAVHSISPIACGKTYLLGKWINEEVPDPYGGSHAEFEHALRLIDQSVDSWMARVWE